MGRLTKIYAVTSLVFLIVLALSPLKHARTEWRRYQKEYRKIQKHLSRQEDSGPVGLQQIWVQDLDRIDRCITCHAGMTNDGMKDSPPPFRKHSYVYHDVEAFGCTICHEGQGLATEYADVHLPSDSWERPVLPKEYTESTCGRCHVDEDLKETPNLNLGRKLVRDYKCFACHDEPGQYSTFTPILDGVGEKVVERGWIAAWLKDPKAVRAETKMPNFLLSDEERAVVADFLMGFKTFAGNTRLESLPRVYDVRKESGDFIDSGRTLFRESPCTSCHRLNEEGGRLSSDLAKIGSKATSVWIYSFIRNPQGLQPGVEMPRFGFSTEDAAAITAYFSSDLLDWDASEEEADLGTIQDVDEQARSLLYKYNCLGCHSLSGVDLSRNGGPEHLTIGSKRVYQIWYGETSIPHTLYDYIDSKLKTPRIFGGSMRMPLFNLTDEDRHAVTTYLLSLRDEELPHAWMRRKSAFPEFAPQGKFGEILQKYSCLKCHTIQGRGETVAPDLSLVGSRLRRDWAEQFLRSPISRRPLIEERMLKLFMAEDDIDTVVDYFYKILLDDSLTVPSGWRPAREAEERGRRLFWETTGCQGCHTVEGRGGYIGPPLDGAGDRLQPGWMLHWLIDPQKYIPETMEPRSGMSVEEALDVLAYLMRL